MPETSLTQIGLTLIIESSLPHDTKSHAHSGIKSHTRHK